MKKYRVYKLKDINGEILYIGYTSKEAIERFAEHARDKYWINRVAEIEECTTTSESQARINEIYWINKIKPIFNAKDKFPGKIDMKLNSKDTRFSHVTYVNNGMITNCIVDLGEEYTLVDTLSLENLNKEIAIYMDSYLNIWLSASDLCQAMGMKRKRPMNFSNNKNLYRREKYSIIERGIEKEYTTYLCNLEGAKLLIDGSKDELLRIRLKNVITDLYNVADLRYSCKNPADTLYNKNILYMAFEEGLSDDYLNDSKIKRKLAYTIILNGMNDIDDTIDSFSTSTELYDLKYKSEIVASDVFSMVEDIINEYGISYKEVFANFSNYLETNYSINFWKERVKLNKIYNSRLQPHFVIAINEVDMLVPFINFYENELKKRAC